MSNIDVTAPSATLEPRAEITPPKPMLPEPVSNGTFARGLAFGLIIGLTFWTLILIEILRHWA